MYWKMYYWAERLGLVFSTMASYEAITNGMSADVVVFIGLSVVCLVIYFVSLAKPQDLPSYEPKGRSTTVSNTILFLLRNGDLGEGWSLYTTQGELLRTVTPRWVQAFLDDQRSKGYTIFRYESTLSDEKMIVLVWDVNPNSLPKEKEDPSKEVPKFSA